MKGARGRTEGCGFCETSTAKDRRVSDTWVYILCCSDGSYYTGRTENPNQRLEQHQMGEGSRWTRKRLPVELVYAQEFPSEEDAFRVERQIKGWTRSKKEALIAGDFELLKHLAKKPRFR